MQFNTSLYFGRGFLGHPVCRLYHTNAAKRTHKHSTKNKH